MKSGLLALVAVSGLFLAAPVSAQGVKIGILNDQSGVYADYGGKYSLEAARMAVEDFGGEVLGQKIEIVTADHQNKPDLGASIARRWYDVEGVDMITELTTSSVALAVQELSKEKKKIDIVVGAASSRLTGDACTPYGFHWAYDTHALAVGTGGALVEAGGNTWFFLTADYAFGYALEKDTTDIVNAKGGKVLGSVRIPLNSSDFSSFLLQAQSSKAKIIGLANAGLDTTNSIKQAAEFGIVSGGQKLAGLLMTLSEVHGLGLQAAQGLVLTEGFYWDLNDKARAFGERFIIKFVDSFCCCESFGSCDLDELFEELRDLLRDLTVPSEELTDIRPGARQREDIKGLLLRIETHQRVRPEVAQPDLVQIVHVDGVRPRLIAGQTPFAPGTTGRRIARDLSHIPFAHPDIAL